MKSGRPWPTGDALHPADGGKRATTSGTARPAPLGRHRRCCCCWTYRRRGHHASAGARRGTPIRRDDRRAGRLVPFFLIRSIILAQTSYARAYCDGQGRTLSAVSNPLERSDTSAGRRYEHERRPALVPHNERSVGGKYGSSGPGPGSLEHFVPYCTIISTRCNQSAADTECSGSGTLHRWRRFELLQHLLQLSGHNVS